MPIKVGGKLLVFADTEKKKMPDELNLISFGDDTYADVHSGGTIYVRADLVSDKPRRTEK